ncbi:MAG: DUF2092 domain-containing protein [Terrimicrobiaceae bacterium]|nr:DUF2092 domain-containing protein [Terrimicrobiaceae bacterium]
MKRPIRPLVLLACSLSVLLPSAGISAAAAATPEKAPPAIGKDALDLLRRMSATLGAAKAFTYKSKSAIEVPAATGQFITLFSTGEVALKRPDKLRALLGGDAPDFDFYYDGATVSAFAPGTGVYSTKPAPPTIDAMLTGLQEETGIRFASAPLLFSDPYAILTRGLLSAVVVGPSTIDGAACTHLAFRSPGVNWEIWIESGPRALPRRMAVTFTDRPNFPRTLIDFSSWNLHPWCLGAGAFVFHKPAGAQEIPFVSVLKSTGRR